MKYSLKIAACLMWSSAIAITALPVASYAKDRDRIDIDLPEQPLGEALKSIGLLSGRTVLVDDESVGAMRAPALHGRFAVRDALQRLLVGSGLSVDRVDGGYIVRAPNSEDASAGRDTIVVTGSRIRGAEVASPVIVLDQQALRDTGYADLGEVARSLPQSFGGGQNPGIGLNVPQSVGANAGGGSSVNLRGLGSDATLTILNGRRLPYDSAFQGVDISAIPMAAVDRIEVVADGASAIYGSDAVGGVVNVILRQDYSGLATRARIGGASDGGDFQQLYGVIAGQRWNGGGFVSYEYNQNEPLSSSQRDTTRFRPNLTLLPGSRRHAVAAHAHQDVLGNLTIEADALYNDRASSLAYPINAASDLHVSRAEQIFASNTLALAMAAHLTLGGWQISLTSTYGKGRNGFIGAYYYNDLLSISQSGRYDNRTLTGELSADGPLFELPGGPARLAAGVGIRDNGFTLFRGADNFQNIDATQQSRYVFGELNLPLAGPTTGIPLVQKLDLSAALRFEDYRAIARIVTPKFGVIYAPNSTIDLKASWGRSFRAPSFYDQYAFQQGLLYPASRFGGTGYPADATALMLSGGNTKLKPERATSWSATVALHPPALGGASLEFSYFATRYIDRVEVPIALTSQALSNPVYASQITRSPTPAQLAAALASVIEFENGTSQPYDPSKVIAIVDDTNTNVGIQHIHGLDALARYQTHLGGGEFSINAEATYLVSRQQIAARQPVQGLAGNLFNPPHWRGRGTLAWDGGGLRLTSTVSYIGGVVDARATPPAALRGLTTVDFGARYLLPQRRGILDGVELGLSVQNAFDAMPPTIATTVFYDTPSDSTNYSPLGRFVALEVTKSW